MRLSSLYNDIIGVKGGTMKYYEMEGQFAQSGQIAPNNRFKGYARLEDEVYSYQDQNVGKVDVQHFEGIHVDQYDNAQKPRLVLGALQSGNETSQTMYFKKLVNSPRMTPLSYGFEQQQDGTYQGEWLPELTMFASGEQAILTKFAELKDEKQIAQAIEFLQKGFDENRISTMPPQMQAIMENYNQTKNAVIRLSNREKIDTPKKTNGSAVKGTEKNVFDKPDNMTDDELPF